MNTKPVAKADKDEIEMEISNLGMHPKECFTRRLITQAIYNESPIQTISVVVWTDLEGRFHFCGAATSSYMSEERFGKVMDALVHEVFEIGVV